MDSAPGHGSAPSGLAASAIYFDGRSSRRRLVTLEFKHLLELQQPGEETVTWPYPDLRRVDGTSGTLRLACLTAPALARLEVREATAVAELVVRCARLDEDLPGRHRVAAIIGWSMAAAASIIGVILFGVPVVAERLTPLVPQVFERQIGDVGERQILAMFGARHCADVSGRAAFSKLVNTVRAAAGMDLSIEATVLATPVPNAFALPGGKVYLLNGLLARADNPDEIAGVLAHEFGHVSHRDSTRRLLHDSGASFLIGLLFGDVTGSGALIFASRSLLTSFYSREAEQSADSFAIDLMHRLGRSPKPMGQLLFRITGREAGRLSIVASHPLTEDRLARMTAEDLPPSGPPLLTEAEWQSLKAICVVEN